MMSETWWVDVDQLDGRQKEVVGLPLEGSHLVIGPPGSGKTNLLLLRAKYMTLAGHKNVAVVIFTRMLQEFIVSGGQEYELPACKVMTCRRWQQALLREYGVEVELPEGFQNQSRYLIDKIEELIEEKKLSGVYDAILLDEAQDYLPEEILVFRKLGKELFAVADSRQKIYKGKDCLRTLRSVVDDCHELRYHYRIGEKICKLADALASDVEGYEPLMKTLNYNEASRPSSVDHFDCADLDEQADRIIEKLSVQLKAYPAELLGVISPSKDAIRYIWERVSESDLGESAVLFTQGEYAPFAPDMRICLCTLHSAKGLEFRALHIAACDGLSGWRLQRNMIYTAVTRAKTSLSLYYSGAIPGYLEQALNSLQPLPDLPALGDLFGRKK